MSIAAGPARRIKVGVLDREDGERAPKLASDLRGMTPGQLAVHVSAAREQGTNDIRKTNVQERDVLNE